MIDNGISIGIDLGHCETAAATPQLNSNNEHSVMRLDTADGNRQVITTQIILTNEQMEKLAEVELPDYKLLGEIGPFRIGDCPAYVPDGERFIYFKVPPKDFDKPYGFTQKAKECGITHKKIMACYVHALLENIYSYNPDVIPEHSKKKVELLIGCPTTEDWVGESENAAYAELVSAATGVENVRIIPESRAAMFSSVENNNHTISALNGAVVFDFGSSTADCTYMLLGRKLLEFSWTLGASEVEHQMVREALAMTMEEAGAFNPDLDNLMNVSDELRKAKEAYFNGLYPPTGKALICTFEDSDSHNPIDSMIRISEKFMNSITHDKKFKVVCDSDSEFEGSWETICCEFFKEAKRRIESSTYKNEFDQDINCPVNTVVITGGASKMSFIEPICKQVFSDPGTIIVTNKANPSHTVSNGLGWVSVTDNNMPECKKKAFERVLRNSKFDDLVNYISDDIFDYIREISEREIRAWADLEGDTATVEDLKNMIDEAINNEGTIEKFKELSEKNIAEWRVYIADEVEIAINKQVQKLYSDNVAKTLLLPKDIMKELNSYMMKTDNIDVGSVLENVDFNGIATQVIKAVTRLVIWAIAVLLAAETGGFSILVGLVVAEVATWFMSDKNFTKPRSKKLRERLANKFGGQIVKKKNEVMGEFKKALSQEFKSFEPIIDEMIDTALEVVTLQRFDL